MVNNIAHFIELLWRMNEMTSVKGLAQAGHEVTFNNCYTVVRVTVAEN